MVSRLTLWFSSIVTPRAIVPAAWTQLALPLLMAADDDKPKLDGATRAKVLAALAALMILWVLVIVLISLGARLTRRYMKSPVDDRARTIRPSLDPDDWAKKPIIATPDEASPETDDSRGPA